MFPELMFSNTTEENIVDKKNSADNADANYGHQQNQVVLNGLYPKVANTEVIPTNTVYTCVCDLQHDFGIFQKPIVGDQVQHCAQLFVLGDKNDRFESIYSRLSRKCSVVAVRNNGKKHSADQ